MSLDVGTRRIGVALSDRSLTIASPYETLHRSHPSRDVEQLIEWIAQEDVDCLVVGWPLQPNGKPGRLAAKVKAVVENILSVKNIRVEYWDERMTSKIAERSLIEGGTRRADRRALVDKVAAAIILQSWLDAQ